MEINEEKIINSFIKKNSADNSEISSDSIDITNIASDNTEVHNCEKNTDILFIIVEKRSNVHKNNNLKKIKKSKKY